MVGVTFPANYVAVQQYMYDALASGEIAIGHSAHIIAQKLLYPPMPRCVGHCG